MRETFEANFAFMLWFVGAVAGLGIGLLLGIWLIGRGVTPDVAAAAGGGVAGGAIAVTGAMAVFWVGQIREEQRDRQRRLRQLNAAKPIMANDLDRITAYLETCSDCASLALQRMVPGEIPGPFEMDAKLRLQQLIELMEGPGDQREVGDLLHLLQLVEARAAGIGSADSSQARSRRAVSLAHALVETRIRIDRAFGYARRASANLKPPPFTEEEVTRAIEGLRLERALDAHEIEQIKILLA